MLQSIIKFSLRNKLIVFIGIAFIIGFGGYSIFKIPIGAVPDITNNQVQVITTSRNLSTQDVEQFITYPVELEMANLPGVEEIRSISKFGLSVVTVVFNDNMGTYLPRQLIAEKIKLAAEKIPQEFGTPQMGPISTGLGEIYQYILDVKPEFKNRYSIMELRTIQDWIVKRQLSGIPGVVEINTWGGYLKQYEVAISPEKLTAMKISVSEILNALEKNNSIAGGGYIEKNSQAYFVRGEGLITSLSDLEKIVVKNNGTPIYIKDIAEVSYGKATRFGAITGNGEGEKVLGQILMLKGGDSNQIISDVKARVAEIQKSLPEGVFINGFLERSELIAKTTRTISENLILGSLIVIFVVVLLLGNLRSGLVVASVIPLSLLFAISLMSLFGVDANLMSLGAIDFGIIIDGAVIIVEFIAFQITRQRNKIIGISKSEKQKEMDFITEKSATKMMNSAIFGQLIILIVFIPILSLSSIEGKMFRPMALTFSFALIGALILCLTYIPVVSSLFLKPQQQKKNNITTRILNFIHKIFSPAIHWGLTNKKMVISLATILFLVSLGLFSRMGGEFVPTLDEGDFVIQPVLKTGTSLDKTIKITTKIEKTLLDNFEEVEQVISRIGAAEVPTDPMSMEESDVIIKLKPKSSWVNASTKNQLASKFKEALSIIPNMEVEFTQPIEMRFNELITGVRADVAIKIFGEDLSILAQKADQVKFLIQDIEGASDIIVEKVEGLPQISILFNRHKIARYGLNIADINKIISMGFAGGEVGSVFEGEKRFDVVVRFNKSQRQNISNIKNLLIDTFNGEKVPLHELAEVRYTKGPAKISRDDTKRRIVIGINVRDRDLQSVVDDVKKVLTNKLNLPVGYRISYGGQFENLQNAKNRLLVAIPVALLLIFVLLYFAFKSVKEALLVYSAIPLSAVGGIFLLWLRDLPFSISAGVGFIALFGIAVLNGIVLIEHFKELKKEGVSDITERITRGTLERLRPVLLTASAAALGFLPMAISTNAGAEVQRPLATVVIGGLVSATLLTLIVLPALYAWFEERKKIKVTKLSFMLVFFTIGIANTNAQENLTLQQTLELALENNAKLKSAKLKVEEKKAIVTSAFNFDKTSVYYSFDENNLAINDLPIRVFGVSQDFKFPTIYFADKKIKEKEINLEQVNFKIKVNNLKKEVYSKYYQLLYNRRKAKTYQYLDSLYQDFAEKSEKKFEYGETNYLEMITAKSKQKKIGTKLLQAKNEVELAKEELKSLVQIENFTIAEVSLEQIGLERFSTLDNLGVAYYEELLDLQNRRVQREKQSLLPDVNLEYFQGTNNQLNNSLYGFRVGLKIPLLFSGNKSKIKASKIVTERMIEEKQQYTRVLNSKYKALLATLKKYEAAISYYNSQGKMLKKEIITTANKSYEEGELDFFQYIQSLEVAQEIELTYIENLNNYNQTSIQINHLLINLI